jgi:hypothetical protein
LQINLNNRLKPALNNKTEYKIKRGIVILLLLLMPLCPGKHDSSLLFNELVFKEAEKTISLPETIEQPVLIQRPSKKPKPSKPHIQTLPEELAFVTLPIELEPIAFAIEEIPLDTAALLAEMKLLRANPLANYQIRKFHIPPVKYQFNHKDFILPLSLIAISAIATNTENYRDILPIKRHNPTDQPTPFDDAFQLVPAPSLFVFDAIGKEKHHPIDQFFIMGISYGLTVLPIRYIKAHYDSPRPYGGNHSFPSGHTATAFVGSHIIYKEFKDSSPWIAYTGYTMGAITAGARVAHDKHWVSDVMAGAGIAILSTELAYLIYFPVRNLITDEANKLFDKYIIISPMIDSETTGLSLSIQF